MIVYDLNSGHREYPGYDEIEDRSAGNRIPVAGLFHITFFWT